MSTKRGLIIGLVSFQFVLGLVLLIVGVSVATWLVVLGAVLAFFGFVGIIFIISSRNTMVRYKHKVSEALALIDIQLKLRFDLIPNLVNTVKGYAKHEKESFEEVIKLRNLALKSEDEKETIDLANKAVPLMKSIIAISEDYPELKASKLYLNLMEQLEEVEDKIVAARRIYDSNVNIYNTKLDVFPHNLVASMFGFEKEKLFRIDANEKVNIDVEL